MNLSRPLFVAALVVAGATLAPVNPAQAATAPTGNALLAGNPVPGLCMLSREAVFAQSKVGQAAGEHLKQLASQQESQLAAQRQPLEAEVQAFQQKEATLTAAQRQQQGAALQQRMQAFQAQAHELDQRIQLTRTKVMQEIGEQAQPTINSSYTSHHCGLLLNRDAVLAGNTSNDLTADVVKGLDARISTLSFNLEPLPKAAVGK